MADYAIGDVQGCFESLQYLLDQIHYDEHQDRLWFVGDLVNRGPQSLAVLRFVKNLAITPRVCLGNHDLHLLSLVFTNRHQHPYDSSLQSILEADDVVELCTWLSQQSLLYSNPDLDVVMVHAGIAPMWTLAQAQTHARALELTLRGPERDTFLANMYGNQPNRWSDTLTGYVRLRVICNYLTRMRFCHADGSLDFEQTGPADPAPTNLYPWYAVPNRQTITPHIIFGHWAALNGACHHPKLHAIDTGCVWGGTLTALRLQDMQRTAISAREKR